MIKHILTVFTLLPLDDVSIPADCDKISFSARRNAKWGMNHVRTGNINHSNFGLLKCSSVSAAFQTKSWSVVSLFFISPISQVPHHPCNQARLWKPRSLSVTRGDCGNGNGNYSCRYHSARGYSSHQSLFMWQPGAWTAARQRHVKAIDLVLMHPRGVQAPTVMLRDSFFYPPIMKQSVTTALASFTTIYFLVMADPSTRLWECHIIM